MKASAEINYIQVPVWLDDERFIRFEIYDPSRPSLWKPVPTNSVIEAYESMQWHYHPKLRVVFEEDPQNSMLPIFAKSNNPAPKKLTPDFIAEYHNDIDKLKQKRELENDSIESFIDGMIERRRKQMVLKITILAMVAVVLLAVSYYLTHRGI